MSLIFKAAFFLITVCFLTYSYCFAISFESTELTIIEFGPEENQLKAITAEYIDLVGTPADTSDDYVEPGVVPGDVFVDEYENIYFGSYSLSYFKAFDMNGNLIVNYTPGQPGFDDRFYKHTIADFYVDSNQHIYFISFPGIPYIPVADLYGNLVDSLRPSGLHDSVVVRRLYHNSDDVICFDLSDKSYFTYEDSAFHVGGQMGWRASNGVYYDAVSIPANKIRFITHTAPDRYGHVTDLQEHFVDYPGELDYVKFIGVDNSLNQYIFVKESNGLRKVQVYDLSYNLLGEAVFDPIVSMYDRYIYPFMRSDGNVYEFRCLEDGLHVIRWSREE